MRAQIFNLTYQPSLGGFDDAALQTLLRDKEPTSFQAQFFAAHTLHGDPRPSLCCLVVWHERESEERESAEPPRTTAAARKRAASHERAQPRERVELELTADQRRVFEALRLWRRARANELSVPAFRVLTDRQLASVARLRPLDAQAFDLQALAALESVGASRAQRCGDSLFGALRAATNTSAAA